jgi:predicted NAD-dependent protein-ADP-ribosyltransferase YbiA (DUF1768 family)
MAKRKHTLNSNGEVVNPREWIEEEPILYELPVSERLCGDDWDKENPIYYSSHCLYTSKQLLDIIWENRHRLNLPFRGLEEGEIDYRNDEARRALWLIQYKPFPASTIEDTIFFNGYNPRYGGPFSFLDNFFSCKFKLPRHYGAGSNGDYTFNSVEQAYHFAKAGVMAQADIRYVTLKGKSVSNKSIQKEILNDKLKPGQCKEFTGAFKRLEKQDPQWWISWNGTWEETAQKQILYDAMRAKFEQNRELGEQLIMTGNFRLVAAASWDSCKDCGIGRTADKAWYEMHLWKKNLNGKALEQVREELHALWYPDLARTFAFKYWRLREEVCNEDRYFHMVVETKKLVGPKVPEKRELSGKENEEWVKAELRKLAREYFERSKAAGRMKRPASSDEEGAGNKRLKTA